MQVEDLPDDLNAEDLEDLDADYALLRELEQKHMVSGAGLI